MVNDYLLLFHWSMSVCILISYFFNYNNFVTYFESESMTPPALFFFNTILHIQVLWFHTNVRIVCSISAKNAIGILVGIALNPRLLYR